MWAQFFATAALEQAAHPQAFPQCGWCPDLATGRRFGSAPSSFTLAGTKGVRPRIAGEFDDSALMSAFGQAGVGFLAKPSAIADMITRQYDLQLVGSTEDIKEQFFAITVQRKITHPAVLAISHAAPLAIINGKLSAKVLTKKINRHSSF